MAHHIGRQTASVVVLFVLATLLPPRDFGLASLAWTWLAFVGAFADPGFSAALVQRSKLEPGHLDSAFAMNVVLGVALAIVGAGLAWPLSAVFRVPELRLLGAALSLTFLVNAFGYTQAALAQRELRFKDLAIRDIGGALAGGVAGIGAALGGLGAWSLVVQALVGSTVGVLLLWTLATWRPRLSNVSRAAVADLWPYGREILGFALLKALMHQVDRVVLGYLLGPAALGVYTFAQRLVLTPVNAVTSGLGGYLFPNLSRVQDDPVAIRIGWLKGVRASLAIVTPLMAMLAAVAPALVPTLMGERWSGAVPVLQVLAPLGVLNAFFAPVGELMKALARPRWLVIWAAFISVATLGGVVLGSPWGASGAAVGVVAAAAVGAPILAWVAHMLAAVRLVDLASLVFRITVPAFVAYLTAVAILDLEADVSALGVGASVLGGTLAYLFLLVALDRQWLVEFRQRIYPRAQR